MTTHTELQTDTTTVGAYEGMNTPAEVRRVALRAAEHFAGDVAGLVEVLDMLGLRDRLKSQQ